MAATSLAPDRGVGGGDTPRQTPRSADETSRAKAFSAAALGLAALSGAGSLEFWFYHLWTKSKGVADARFFVFFYSFVVISLAVGAIIGELVVSTVQATPKCRRWAGVSCLAISGAATLLIVVMAARVEPEYFSPSPWILLGLSMTPIMFGAELVFAHGLYLMVTGVAPASVKGDGNHLRQMPDSGEQVTGRMASRGA